jgi:hypothetical protein
MIKYATEMQLRRAGGLPAPCDESRVATGVKILIKITLTLRTALIRREVEKASVTITGCDQRSLVAILISLRWSRRHPVDIGN